MRSVMSHWLRGIFALCCTGALLYAAQALAYRPFDGTDAAVADKGEFELELGPLGF